jgi:hypothetical protein
MMTGLKTGISKGQRGLLEVERVTFGFLPIDLRQATAFMVFL